MTLLDQPQGREAVRKQVLVFRELPPDQLERLQAVHDVIVANPRKPEERDRFDVALAQAQGMIGSSFPVDAALLARAPRLEVVSSVSVGVDNYALDALQARGILLCHTPGVLQRVQKLLQTFSAIFERSHCVVAEL